MPSSAPSSETGCAGSWSAGARDTSSLRPLWSSCMRDSGHRARFGAGPRRMESIQHLRLGAGASGRSHFMGPRRSAPPPRADAIGSVRRPIQDGKLAQCHADSVRLPTLEAHELNGRILFGLEDDLPAVRGPGKEIA
jgi:hypothetical protein